jgi:hypothetical protein
LAGKALTITQVVYAFSLRPVEQSLRVGSEVIVRRSSIVGEIEPEQFLST